MPRPAAPGLSAAYDYEYERNGVSSLFMLFAPLDGWRRVEVRERRTKVDWAHVIKKLVDEDYLDRDRIVLVMDNLNTHKLSSLYEAFEPAEARRIAERLEIHYTPKHGSWLNMAEIEIGVLARQCLDRRIANQDILRGEVNAWQNQRNRDVIRVDWRFTTEDARIKLKSLYPSIQKLCRATRTCVQTVCLLLSRPGEESSKSLCQPSLRLRSPIWRAFPRKSRKLGFGNSSAGITWSRQPSIPQSPELRGDSSEPIACGHQTPSTWQQPTCGTSLFSRRQTMTCYG